MNYIDRLRIPIQGDNTTIFKTDSNLIIAMGYKRIVIGERGPYIEFDESQIDLEKTFIPESEKYRVTSGVVYYIEYRTIDSSNVKIYYQKKLVKYADYKLGLFYISPFDLYVNGVVVIEKLQKGKKD